MSDDWYVHDGNQQFGPISGSTLKQWANDGRITPETQIRKGQSAWMPATKVQGLQLTAVTPPTLPASPPQQATQQCPFCAASIPLVAKKCQHCGEAIDPALRAAEEAKRTAELASRGGGSSAVASTTVVAPTTVINQRKSFPHFLHLVLTVVTCGFWFPIWLIHYLIWTTSS